MASLVTSVKQLKRNRFGTVQNELTDHPHYQRMKTLASDIISGEQMYSTLDLVSMVSKKAAIPAERAAKGVAMLKELNIILPTLNTEFFYLNGSTPF